MLKVDADPGEVGLDPDRLRRLDDAFRSYVDDGRLAGWTLAVSRRGKVAHLTHHGLADLDSGRPVGDDTLWRIYSMTKPITSVAAMMLYEEGRFELTDPVAKFIPEFAEPRVYVGGAAAAPGTRPAVEPLRVWHLLTHTAGLTYGFHHAHAVDEMYRARGYEFGVPEGQDLAAACAGWARFPLLFDPGTEWNYSVSTDVLGRVVEVVSGMSLDRFFAERILKPLGMSATGFGPVAAARVAEPQVDKASGKRPPLRDVTKKPVWLSGGSGLLSSAADYLRFCQMLLNGGELGGVRLLAPATVALMSADHLAPGIAYGAQMRAMFGALAPTPENGLGFGLGFAVRNEAGRCALPGSVGDYSWSGVAGTYFWIDPREQLIAILMMQAPIERMHYRYLMRAMVYQAMVG